MTGGSNDVSSFILFDIMELDGQCIIVQWDKFRLSLRKGEVVQILTAGYQREQRKLRVSEVLSWCYCWPGHSYVKDSNVSAPWERQSFPLPRLRQMAKLSLGIKVGMIDHYLQKPTTTASFSWIFTAKDCSPTETAYEAVWSLLLCCT